MAGKRIRLVAQMFDLCSYGALARAYVHKFLERGDEVLFDIIVCDKPLKIKTVDRKFVLADPRLTFLQPTIDLVNESKFRVFYESFYSSQYGQMSFVNIPDLPYEQQTTFFKGNRFKQGDYDETWFFTTWHYLPMLRDKYVPTHFRTVFEGMGCDTMYVKAVLKYTDHVYVPSTYCQKTLNKYGIEAHLLPDTYLFDYPTPDEATHLAELQSIWPQPQGQGKLYLCLGDWLPRKGIKDTIRWFKKHCSADDRLFIKTHISATKFFPEDREDKAILLETQQQKDNFLADDLVACGAIDPRIVVIAGISLNNADIEWMHQNADIYAALYRAEGFLLPTYYHAYKLNKPVIATKGGAADDYLIKNGATISNATLIPSEVVEVEGDETISTNDLWLQKAVDPYFFFGDNNGEPARWLRPIF